MKPRPSTLVLLLVLGAIGNVGVAWIAAWWEPLPTRGAETLDAREAGRLLRTSGGNTRPNDDLIGFRIPGRGLDRILVVNARRGGVTDLSGHGIIHASGWPMRSLVRAGAAAGGRPGMFRWRAIDIPEAEALNAAARLAREHAGAHRYADAARLCREALEHSRRLLGTEHPVTLALVNDLAGAHELQGRSDEAEPLRITVLESCRRLFGDDHPRTLVARTNLGLLWRAQGRTEEAERLFVDALRTLDPDKGQDRALPGRPIWLGFAVDTLVYAALVWLLFLFAPRALRRLVRARRGRCPACGYPVGVSAACTECGAPVRPKGRPRGHRSRGR